MYAIGNIILGVLIRSEMLPSENEGQEVKEAPFQLALNRICITHDNSSGIGVRHISKIPGMRIKTSYHYIAQYRIFK